MRRVLAYSQWKVGWWEKQLEDRYSSMDPDDPLAEGLNAYAHRQMALERCIHTQWQAKWQPMQNSAKLIINGLMGPDWLCIYEDHTTSMVTESTASIEDSITQVIELDIGEDERIEVES